MLRIYAEKAIKSFKICYVLGKKVDFEELIVTLTDQDCSLFRNFYTLFVTNLILNVVLEYQINRLNQCYC